METLVGAGEGPAKGRDPPIAAGDPSSARDGAARADGDADVDVEPRSGAAARDRHGTPALQRIRCRRGPVPAAAGEGGRMGIGARHEEGRQVAEVIRPSPGACLDRLDCPDYRAATRHRVAGPADTRLIVTDGALSASTDRTY